MAFKYLDLCPQHLQLMDLESYSTHLKLVFYRLGNWDSSVLISSSMFFSLFMSGYKIYKAIYITATATFLCSEKAVRINVWHTPQRLIDLENDYFEIPNETTDLRHNNQETLKSLSELQGNSIIKNLRLTTSLLSLTSKSGATGHEDPADTMH